MGSHLVRSYITERDTAPDPTKPFQNDPEFGFEQRTERGEHKNTHFQKDSVSIYSLNIHRFTR